MNLHERLESFKQGIHNRFESRDINAQLRKPTNREQIFWERQRMTIEAAESARSRANGRTTAGYSPNSRDTLYTSEVSYIKALSPVVVDAIRTVRLAERKHELNPPR